MNLEVVSNKAVIVFEDNTAIMRNLQFWFKKREQKQNFTKCKTMRKRRCTDTGSGRGEKLK